MYDILLFVLGVWVGRMIWKSAINHDVRETVLRVATVAVVAVIYFFPAGFEKEVHKWEPLPTETYYVSDGTPVSDWKSYGLATVYSNTREFLNSGDETPIIVYNPDSYTADEARVAYRNEQ